MDGAATDGDPVADRGKDGRVQHSFGTVGKDREAARAFDSHNPSWFEVGVREAIEKG